MRIRTDRWLQEIYRTMNFRFFDGRLQLPAIRVTFASAKEMGKCDGMFVRSKGEIKIHKDFAKHESMCVITLLHEMCHLAIHENGYMGADPTDDHYMLFYNEIARLWRLGAYETILIIPLLLTLLLFKGIC